MKTAIDMMKTTLQEMYSKLNIAWGKKITGVVNKAK